ncbi:large-conductance mechanosensitive channel protein MscL [Cognatilysobacter lacus]|uniref:Large-conductance mechanosensitive channel n=1 Tax=Cognatilysobacter lacus TaxID=1643323 RepID=A0A5D8YXS0_9GAMM|nr:large-conductance mechanosensitive channel protein MscL [Lysobacter lacus]TZF87545.1 large-conductance mechanosensitive channel protein MscL [Lysobacter lacus]
MPDSTARHGFLQEFSEFIARGNVVDLAVGVVIGAAFGKIVSALVDGIVMPLLSTATNGIKVDQWKLVLKPAVLGGAGRVVSPEIALKYGAVLQAALDFVIIAFVIFLFLRTYNRLREREPTQAPPPAEDVVLLREIRDLLTQRPRAEP